MPQTQTIENKFENEPLKIDVNPADAQALLEQAGLTEAARAADAPAVGETALSTLVQIAGRDEKAEPTVAETLRDVN